MKLSIITTFYKDEKTIVEALKSVKKQTFKDYELVLVNDCSPDGSMGEVMNFLDKSGKTFNNKVNIVIPGKNLGCGGARALGISEAKGDYFMFLDADDYYISPTFCEDAVSALDMGVADMVCFAARYCRTDNPLDYDIFGVRRPQLVDGSTAFNMLWDTNNIRFNVWDKIYKRKVIESHPYSEARTFEDLQTMPFWLKASEKVLILPEISVYYRYNENSIIHKDIFITRRDTVKASFEMIKAFSDDLEAVKKIYSRCCQDVANTLAMYDTTSEEYKAMSAINLEIMEYVKNLKNKENGDNDKQ